MNSFQHDPICNRILEILNDQPIPPFLIAKKLQISFDEINAHLDQLKSEGCVKTFDMFLLGKSERLYYR